ncbi:phosphoribosylformylglycinamidine synthase I [Candidatus Jorgensenbacteria bacterium RIFCSPLOWO2_01_FULL_45_25b]|uniref:Phosphoribosylformylglycinamidine synthase subunit PurQ n=1 Tax=Candidatus Jorgensenbacteria bacterium RIFCSPLOWO2_01_FULL_45_25b TaxID=1798471 RepID=A0A1F6BS22_9BACT|nr:MAG: phosphoribosylformylglycinamidine synthase I [Candidatus Jorgensenbacteria bacterium RIFCSPLOWO2_01_FULL_45_25b]
MKVGVIRFPGSNCDFDTLHFFKKFGHKAEFIWYKDVSIPRYDLLVLPGGFAFGDRVYAKATGHYDIDPGVLAISSPVLKAIKRVVRLGVPILGICNGFQILVKAGLLPGKLVQNDSKKFFCDYVRCAVQGASFFGDPSMLGKTFIIPVAHGYGRYIASARLLNRLQKNKQIFLRYSTFNPNGSALNIAGVCNEQKTIFGMMPHPERSLDGKYFMRAIETYVAGN